MERDRSAGTPDVEGGGRGAIGPQGAAWLMVDG
jgi:hypothetical protein